MCRHRVGQTYRLPSAVPAVGRASSDSDRRRRSLLSPHCYLFRKPPGSLIARPNLWSYEYPVALPCTGMGAPRVRSPPARRLLGLPFLVLITKATARLQEIKIRGQIYVTCMCGPAQVSRNRYWKPERHAIGYSANCQTYVLWNVTVLPIASL